MSSTRSSHTPSHVSPDHGSAYEFQARKNLIINLWNGGAGLPVSSEYTESRELKKTDDDQTAEAFGRAREELKKSGWFDLYRESSQDATKKSPNKNHNSYRESSEAQDATKNKNQNSHRESSQDANKNQNSHPESSQDATKKSTNKNRNSHRESSQDATKKSTNKNRNQINVTDSDDFDSIEIDILFHGVDRGGDLKFDGSLLVVKPENASSVSVSTSGAVLKTQISDKAIFPEKIAQENNESPNCYVVFEVTTNPNLMNLKLLQLERVLTVLLCRKQIKNPDMKICDLVRVSGIITTANKKGTIVDILNKDEGTLKLIKELAIHGRFFCKKFASSPVKTNAVNVAKIENKLGNHIKGIQTETAEMKNDIVKLEERINSIAKNQESIEERIDSIAKNQESIEERIDSIAKNQESIEERINSIAKNQESVQKEMVEMKQNIQKEMAGMKQNIQNEMGDIKNMLSKLLPK
jgi:chaperonin cofactor prefoldin